MQKGLWIDKNTFMPFNGKQNWSITDEIVTRKRSMDFFLMGTMLPNPDPVLKRMGKDIIIYEEIKRESHVSCCISSRKAGVKSLSWEIGKEKGKTREVELIENRFKKFKMQDIMDEILDAPLFGYKPMEAMWDDAEFWLPNNLVGKPPEWFCYDTDNTLRFRTKENFWEGELLPDKKILCPRHRATYKNPYGESELSKVFWPVAFKKGGWEFWMTFIEKYGMPFAVGKHPPGASKEEKDELAQALENAVQDAILVISENSSFEIKESPYKQNSTGTYKELHDTCNAEISKVILGQTLTTELPKGSGSRAASETHNKVREDIVSEDGNLVEQTFNGLIDWTWELNFQNREDDVPKFRLVEPENINKEKAERDKTLTETGVKWKKIYFMKNYSLEDEDFEVGEPPAPKQASQTGQPPVQFSEQTAQGAQDKISELEKAVSDKELQRIAEELLNPVMELVKNGNSYQDILGALSEQYPLMNTEVMQGLFEKAMFISAGAGRLSNITK
jgi:phage gp29-like protein